MIGSRSRPGTVFGVAILGLMLAAPCAHAQGNSVNATVLPWPPGALSIQEGDAVSSNTGPSVLRIPIGSAASSEEARKERTARPWWIGSEIGGGRLKLTSDQASGNTVATFALGFAGGHSLGDRARIGVEVNGWLMQAYNLSNPAVGESVSNVLAVFDVFPVRRIPLFLRGGAGAAFYENNRPNGFGGSGWAWTAGGGYEFPISEQLGLAPMVDYAAGGFGDVRNIITVETGRRYSVIDFRAALIWHFGKPKKS